METTNGKLMPMNPKAELRCVLVLADDHLILAGKGDGAEYIRARSVPTYVSHFATCPNAADWRKR